MTTGQKIWKGIYYYALIILTISASLYALGLVGSYFHGFTFLFSTDYGWDAVASFAFLMGIVFAIWCVPLALYAGIFWLYAHKKEVFGQLQLKDYIKKWQFYTPIFLVVMITVVYALCLFADGVISYYAPLDMTEHFDESLSGSLYYEVKSNDELSAYAGKTYQMDMVELVDMIGACGDIPYEELEPIVTFLNENRQNNGFFVLALPEHTGKTTDISVKKVTWKKAKNLIQYEFDRKADDSKDVYFSFYIVDAYYVDYIHVPDEAKEEREKKEKKVDIILKENK